MPDTTEPTPTAAGSVPGGVPVSRHTGGRRPTGPIAVGAVLFVLGLIAIAVIMVLFATGSHDLPLWLNLTAMLAPIGFGIGLVGILQEARADRAARAARVRVRPAGDPHSGLA